MSETPKPPRATTPRGRACSSPRCSSRRSVVPRLPGYRRWLSADDFAGLVSVRWQPGTAGLPPHLLGHVGYTVVPWKCCRGYATAALRQLLPRVRRLGLPYLELTTDVNNIASQKVITANGGVLIERFASPRRTVSTAQRFVGGSRSRDSVGSTASGIETCRRLAVICGHAPCPRRWGSGLSNSPGSRRYPTPHSPCPFATNG